MSRTSAAPGNGAAANDAKGSKETERKALIQVVLGAKTHYEVKFRILISFSEYEID